MREHGAIPVAFHWVLALLCLWNLARQPVAARLAERNSQDYGVSEFRLVVRDSGRGIDAEVLQSGRTGHWGLVGMRERAERAGGRLKVWSRAGAGTEVELTIPGQIAYSRPGRESDGTKSSKQRCNSIVLAGGSEFQGCALV